MDSCSDSRVQLTKLVGLFPGEYHLFIAIGQFSVHTGLTVYRTADMPLMYSKINRFIVCRVSPPPHLLWLASDAPYQRSALKGFR